MFAVYYVERRVPHARRFQQPEKSKKTTHSTGGNGGQHKTTSQPETQPEDMFCHYQEQEQLLD
jgi:hypothetical protein